MTEAEPDETRERFRPFGLREDRELGQIVVYTDPDTPTGKNWLAVDEEGHTDAR